MFDDLLSIELMYWSVYYYSLVLNGQLDEKRVLLNSPFKT